MKRLIGAVVGNGRIPLKDMPLIPVAVAFAMEVFFSISSLVGYNYEGSTESSVYYIYWACVAVAGYGYAFLSILRRAFITNRQLIVFFVPLVVTAGFLFDSAFGRVEVLSSQYFLFWWVFATPALVAGAVASRSGILKNMSLALEPLMAIFTGASIAYSATTVSAGWQRLGLGGATYQTASYIAAASFTFNLYHILMGENGTRWKYATFGWYRLISYALLPVQVVAVLLSGGRGGFVLIIVSTVVLVGSSFVNVHRNVSRRYVGVFLVLVTTAIVAVPWLLRDGGRADMFLRVFAYVGDSGIIWSGTSGRDVVYEDALKKISSSSVFGYGLFSWGGDGYPHNMLLEWLLNGGVFYLVFWLILLSYLIIRVVRTAAVRPHVLILLPLLVYPLTLLMFSGTYWGSGPFWFAVALAFCLDSEFYGQSTFVKVNARRPLR